MPQVVAVDSLVVPRALLMIFGPSSEPLSPKSITKIGCSGVKFPHRHDLIPFKGGLIVSRNYRMLIYRTFQLIEKNIVSNFQYRVSRYCQAQ